MEEKKKTRRRGQKKKEREHRRNVSTSSPSSSSWLVCRLKEKKEIEKKKTDQKKTHLVPLPATAIADRAAIIHADGYEPPPSPPPPLRLMASVGEGIGFFPVKRINRRLASKKKRLCGETPLSVFARLCVSEGVIVRAVVDRRFGVKEIRACLERKKGKKSENKSMDFDVEKKN